MWKAWVKNCTSTKWQSVESSDSYFCHVSLWKGKELSWSCFPSWSEQPSSSMGGQHTWSRQEYFWLLYSSTLISILLEWDRGGNGRTTPLQGLTQQGMRLLENISLVGAQATALQEIFRMSSLSHAVNFWTVSQLILFAHLCIRSC